MSSGHEVLLGYEWLKAVLTGDSTLMGYATGGVFHSLAPPNTAPPFVIMSYQAGIDVTTLNAFRLMDELSYQVKVVGPVTLMSTLALAAERIDILLGLASGTITGGYILSCYREQPLMMDELVNTEVWTNVGGLYRLQLEQTS
jgi:hypothetical protein